MAFLNWFCFITSAIQWRSQEIFPRGSKSRGSGGQKPPSGVQGRSPGWVWGQSPQTLTTLLWKNEDLWSQVRLISYPAASPPPKKKSRICANYKSGPWRSGGSNCSICSVLATPLRLFVIFIATILVDLLFLFVFTLIMVKKHGELDVFVVIHNSFFKFRQ